MPRFLLSSRALLVALCLAAPAWADDAQEAAKIRIAAQEFDAGRRAYLQQDYESAAVHFENADRDAPSIEALRLAIRARKEGGHAARAATLAQQALKRYPGDEATVSLARAVIQELSPGLFRLRVQCNPACGLVINDKAVFEDQSTDQTVYLTPGQHSVAASWTQGKGRAVRVDGAKGREQLLVLKPVALTPPPAASEVVAPPPADTGPAPQSESGLSPALFYISAGVTAALAGVTVWSGIDTRNNPGRATVEAACVNLGEDCPAYQDGRSRQTRTNILLGTTIGMGVLTGVVAVYTRWGKAPEDKPKAGFRLEPQVGWAGGLQAGAVGRF
jgi:hypothetical protein